MPLPILLSMHSKAASKPGVTSSLRGEWIRGGVVSLTEYVGVLVSLFLLWVGRVAALTAPVLENLNNASNLAWGANAPRSIGGIVAQIILAVLGLLGVIFVVLLTYGGFLWVTSAGEEDKVKKATGLIFNSIIGSLIVIAAYAITYYVLRKLSGALGG